MKNLNCCCSFGFRCVNTRPWFKKIVRWSYFSAYFIWASHLALSGEVLEIVSWVIFDFFILDGFAKVTLYFLETLLLVVGVLLFMIPYMGCGGLGGSLWVYVQISLWSYKFSKDLPGGFKFFSIHNIKVMVIYDMNCWTYFVRFSTNNTFIPCWGDLPKYIPTFVVYFHLGWGLFCWRAVLSR